MALTQDDVKSLISIIDGAENLEEIELVLGGIQIHLWRSAGASQAAPEGAIRAAQAPAIPSSAKQGHDRASEQSAPARPAAQPSADLALEPAEVVIRAPMLGTFYRAASPGEAPYVEVGQRVGAGDTVCLIEVMKLFNSIRAGVDGTVTRVLHENATMVEFGEPLMVIRSGSAGGN